MNKPIFADIFGARWDQLPPIFKKHYQNRPFSDDNYRTIGKMNVYLSPLAQFISPLLALSKTLIPKSGDNIDVIVDFKSNPNNNTFTFARVFNFSNKSFKFTSIMQPIGGNELIEWTESGIGWHCAFNYEDGKVILSHCGYALKLFGKVIPLPLEFIAGRGYAYETAINDNRFDMYMEIKHFIFGRIYSYSGEFYIE